MKKGMALGLLVLTAAATLSGCGGEGRELLGSWEGDADVTGMFRQVLSGSAVMEKYVELGDVELDLELSLEKDGTYALGVNEDSMARAREQVLEQVKRALASYVEDLAAQNGLEKSAQEMLEAMGLSMDELADAALYALDADLAVGWEPLEGRYKVSGGRIYVSTDREEAAGDVCWISYTLSEDVLELSEAAGLEAEMMQLLPLRFSRQEEP